MPFTHGFKGFSVRHGHLYFCHVRLRDGWSR
jgi:hypothetical protein